LTCVCILYKVVPGTDLLLLSEMDHRMLCMLMFVYFRLKPITLLSDLGLAFGKVVVVLAILYREAVLHRSIPGGLASLDP